MVIRAGDGIGDNVCRGIWGKMVNFEGIKISFQHKNISGIPGPQLALILSWLSVALLRLG